MDEKFQSLPSLDLEAYFYANHLFPTYPIINSLQARVDSSLSTDERRLESLLQTSCSFQL